MRDGLDFSTRVENAGHTKYVSDLNKPDRSALPLLNNAILFTKRNIKRNCCICEVFYIFFNFYLYLRLMTNDEKINSN